MKLIEYKDYKLQMIKTKYVRNNRIALVLQTEDGEPFVTMSVNIPNNDLGEDEMVLDINNFEDGIGIMEKYGFGKPIDVVQSGWVLYPIYKLDMDKINEYAKEVE